MAAYKSKLMMFVLILVALGFLMPFAQDKAQGWSPLPLSLTGIFNLPGEKGVTQGLNTFQVFIQGKELIFNVKRSQDLTGSELSWEVLQVLNHVFPPILHFSGPQDVIRPLEKLENMGKPVTVTGYLYPAEGLLLVVEVKNVG